MIIDFINLTAGEGPLYLRLYDSVRKAAECGAVKGGERLPSVREASARLGVSRTTVEGAYLKLCIEGIAESRPQRGYFICDAPRQLNAAEGHTAENKIRYDFSGKKIDAAAADTELWKKTVREVLRDSFELTSYGDPQGEPGLRRVLADYCYKARGVRTSPECIVIGAGVGPLLSILCGIAGNNRTVVMEGGFEQASRIFRDHSMECRAIPCDGSGAIAAELEKSPADTLFLVPSQLSKISVTALAARRAELRKWLAADSKRLVIEDDYNGELRRSARGVTAFQGNSPEKTVYIGSFSKLLLPSVRIAYMVLPVSLAAKFRAADGVYNQTCGKTEQLALCNYISSGALERHLRRLRKLYAKKSRLFSDAMAQYFPGAETVLYESSMTAVADFKVPAESKGLCTAAEAVGIRLIPTDKAGTAGLCLTGIAEEEIFPAVREIKRLCESI